MLQATGAQRGPFRYGAFCLETRGDLFDADRQAAAAGGRTFGRGGPGTWRDGAVAQSKTDDPQKGAQNGGQNGATAELPHSRTPDKDLPPLSLLPRSGDELEGSEEAPGGHTCPDRGNTLELII
jgi:hypothetical protein